ncbi:AgmX/PglI C-terminal domain-containing protein [Halomonadaceae bacterium KBTZ08]
MNRSPALPWRSTRREDRLLGVILAVLLVFFVPLALVIPGLDLPERSPQQPEEPQPQVARMLEEPEEPEPEPEPEPDPEPEPETSEPDPAPTPAEPEETVEQAREVAEESGLVGMKDELAQLRELAPEPETEIRESVPGSEGETGEVPSGPDKQRIMAGSGGPDEPTGGGVEDGGMQRRETRDVASAGASGEAESRPADTEPSERPMANIRKTFQRNRSALFSIYNRARRQNPLLEGEVVLALVIAPDGSVVDVTVADSTLGDEGVARKIADRVTLFDFGAMDVPERSVRFPVDLAPPG